MKQAHRNVKAVCPIGLSEFSCAQSRRTRDKVACPAEDLARSSSVCSTMAQPSGLQELSQLKISEVPAYAKQVANKDLVQNKLTSWLRNYHQKYIKTSSIKPAYHTFVVIGLIGYAVGWPAEMRHLRHKEEEERLKRAGVEVKDHH